MFVIPEWDMVIVRLGLDQTEFHITDKICGTFLQKIGQAIMDVTSEVSQHSFDIPGCGAG